MENSEEFTEKPGSPGSVLRAAREEQGLSIQEVASQLNWQVIHVEAVEQNRFEELRGSLFARGYIRAYGRVLELPDAKLQTLLEYIELTPVEMEMIPNFRRTEVSYWQTPAVGIAVGIAVLLLLVLGLWTLSEQGYDWWLPATVLSPVMRRPSRQIRVGDVAVGGDAPISVQSMTNTETCDIEATVAQIESITEAGADIVRVSVPTMAAAEAFRRIRERVSAPLVADIHFDHKIALKVVEHGVDCLRINPGNIGREQKVRAVIDSCRDRGVPIRIGVNAGSLGKDIQRKYREPCAAALVESAMRHVDILDRLDYPDFKLSVKASEVFMAVESYRLIARQIDQPLHLGITEAGGLRGGTVKSAVGLGMLLMEGIGDTIRVSLAADPVEEVKVGFEILKSLKLRSNGINFIACPSCSRQNFDVIGAMNVLEQRLEDVRTPMDVAVIGCIVNGPGEAREADVGLTGASPSHLIYLAGEPDHKVDGGDFIDHLEQVIRRRAGELEAERAEAEKNLIHRA